MNIGIIGKGRFGRLLEKQLSTDNVVVSVDKTVDTTSVGTADPRSLHLEDCDLIIFAVPNRLLEEAIVQWKSHIRPDAIVMDVGSVKVLPAELLLKHFPVETCHGMSLLATHPLFGPDSAGESWQGRKMVFCRLRITDQHYTLVEKLFTKRGVIPLACTPAEHDAMMARTQALVHFIGRALTGIQPQEIATPDYDNLLKMMEKVTNDTWELFFDMQNLNAQAAVERKKFIAAIQSLDKDIEQDARQRSSDDTVRTADSNLSLLRSQIDAIDEQIITLIGQRFQIVKNVGELKAHSQHTIQDAQRETEVYLRLHRLAQTHQVPLEVVIHIYDYLMGESRKVQQ